MLVDHVAPPIVLSGKRLAPAARVGACRIDAIVLPRLHVFVVDVSVEVRLSAEPLVTPGMGALMWSVMIAFVMAGSMSVHVLSQEGRARLSSTYLSLWIWSKVRLHSLQTYPLDGVGDGVALDGPTAVSRGLRHAPGNNEKTPTRLKICRRRRRAAVHAIHWCIFDL